MVTYPGTGPSVCDRILRKTPGVVAGGVVCADASVATNPVSEQSAQDAKPAKFRRVSMATSLWCPDRERPDFRDGQYPQSYLILSLSTVFCKRRGPTESATKQEPRSAICALWTGAAAYFY
jgi:hypothetical protein